MLMAGKIPLTLASQNQGSKASKTQTPSQPPNRSNKYAYGLVDTLVKDKRIVWHNGGAPGTGTQFDMFPELGWTLVILSNYSWGKSIGSLAMKAEELIIQAELP